MNPAGAMKYQKIFLIVVIFIIQCVHSAATVAKVGPLATVNGLPIACAVRLQFYCVVSEWSVWWLVCLGLRPPSLPSDYISWQQGVVIVLHVCSHVGSFYWLVAFDFVFCFFFSFLYFTGCRYYYYYYNYYYYYYLLYFSPF